MINWPQADYMQSTGNAEIWYYHFTGTDTWSTTVVRRGKVVNDMHGFGSIDAAQAAALKWLSRSSN